MRNLPALLFCLLLLISSSFSRTGSTGIPPNESKTLGNRVPDVTLVDSEGNEFNLYSLKGKPSVISLIYTRCTSACPIIVKSLKEIVKELNLNLEEINFITLSFDPGDKVEDLKKFKEKNGLSWRVVTVKDREELFQLLDALDFRFATADTGDYIHPNLIVFLDKDMIVRKYLYGVTYDRMEFVNALRIAQGKISLPEKFRGHLFFVGMMGITGTLIFLVFSLSRKKKS